MKSRSRFDVSPLEALVLIHHVVHSDDASNDAERTVDDLIQDLDRLDGMITKGVLESALYCCNMEDEKKKFWHPLKYSFDYFVKELLPLQMRFDKYYNVIFDHRDKENGHLTTPRR